MIADEADRVAEIARAALITDARTPHCEGVPGIDYLPACASDAIRELPLLFRRCKGCAFRTGTEAFRNQLTRSAALECVSRSHPFMCHMAEDEIGEKTHLCAGWADAIVSRAHLQDQTS